MTQFLSETNSAWYVKNQRKARLLLTVRKYFHPTFYKLLLLYLLFAIYLQHYSVVREFLWSRNELSTFHSFSGHVHPMSDTKDWPLMLICTNTLAGRNIIFTMIKIKIVNIHSPPYVLTIQFSITSQTW